MEPVDSIIHICPAEPGVPRLTIFRPRTFRAGEPLPALVYLHGGGWSLGSLATYEPFCRQLANACNMIVIWVEYRLAPEHPFPAAYHDTLAAWRWIQSQCRRDRRRSGRGWRWAATVRAAIWRQRRSWRCARTATSCRGGRSCSIPVWTFPLRWRRIAGWRTVIC